MQAYRGNSFTCAGALLAIAGCAAPVISARADVTVQQLTSMNVAGMKIDIHSTERTSADRQRRDSVTQCHGLLAIVCRNAQTGEIVRLDRQLEWELQPKKKIYTERAFPTPAQRAEAQQRLQAAMEEMKKCPMPESRSTSLTAPDTSHCQLSPPVVSVKRTDEHTVLFGHDARKSSVVLSQSCTDTQTGDVCEMNYGFDTWLTTDDIPGSAERNEFTRKYLAAQGLDPSNPQLRGMMQQLMAPYADSLKQLRAKAADLQGHPLRTTFYMAFGGPHCGRAQQARQQQAQERRGGGFSLGGVASNAVRGGLAGLFHRGVGAIHADSTAGAAAAGAAAQAADPVADAAANAATRPSSGSGEAAPATPASPFVQVMSLTTETTSIDTAPIPADQFDIPGGWKLQQPKAEKAKEFSCPASAK